LTINESNSTSKLNNSASPTPPVSPTGYLAQDYNTWQSLLVAQPAIVQRFLESQAHKLADALVSGLTQIRFTLPDQVIVNALGEGEKKGQAVVVPPAEREQMAGGLLDQLARTSLSAVLRQRLAELETSPNPAVAASGGLICYTTAYYLVHLMLPSGRTVTYQATGSEDIPSIPVGDELEPASAITAATDAIVKSEDGFDEGRGELQVPYVPAARRFYLPQWIAFDDQDHLLVHSISEAEAHIASMQRYLGILHAAVALAPYMVVDEDYQQKRYGILGQLVNQGRSLARYETDEIIRTIKQRATAQDLNRGLSLSLPYFDDRSMEMKTHDFEIIPAGRIMFVPAFVVRAARQEQAKVAQDTRLSPSIRKHLLGELRILESAFTTSGKPN
jgi:hypothetical protein